MGFKLIFQFESKTGENMRQIFITNSLLVAVAMMMSVHAKADDILDDTVNIINNSLDIILPGDFDMRDVNVQLGLGVGTAPEYTGSDHYSLRYVPLISVSYKDKFRFFGTEGLLTLYGTKNFRTGLLIRYRGGRGENDHPSLNGLGDVGGGFEGGAYVEGRVKKSVFRLRLAQDLSGEHDGLMLTMTADQGVYQSSDGKWVAGVGLRATWVSKDYAQTYFGVTPEQSLASGLNIYSPSSGIRDVVARGIIRYDMSKHWRISTLVQFGRLLGDIADSPLVEERGSAMQALGGVGVFYRF